MGQQRQRPARFGAFALLGVLWVAIAACNSTPAAKNAQDKTADAASGSQDAQVGLMCVGEHISNPPEPFHYSYKYSGSPGSIDIEAEITPQSMDIISNDGTGAHSYHAVRSDDTNWNSAVLIFSGLRFTGLAARVESLNGTSALVREGTESINGYNTTKYAIDTTRANPSDRQQFETMFNKGSFEKGTVWASSDGCAVNLVLDEAIFQNDGSVDKVHYEFASVKK